MKIYVAEIWHEGDIGIFDNLEQALRCASGSYDADSVNEMELKDGEFEEVRKWCRCGKCREFKEDYGSYYRPPVMQGIVCDECAAKITGVA